MTIRYVDLVGGNDSNDGSTFALRKLTIASAVAGLGANDEVRVMASPAAVFSQLATWTNGSGSVTLSSAVTATISQCETPWTAAANVTATASATYRRQGSAGASLAIASGFTTGLVAYQALAATTDFSSYQQVSLWVRLSSAKVADIFQLCLCSDAAGAVPVDTFNLPALPSGGWVAVVLDKAAPLGSAIQSVALYAPTTDPGTVSVYLDNIVACGPSAAVTTLTHHSLISKATDANEPWFAIDAFEDAVVILGTGSAGINAKTTEAARYYGASATTLLFKRAPILVSASVGVNESGSAYQGDELLVSGGWDTTAMSTQDDRTWLRGAGTTIPVALNGYYGYRWQKFGVVAPGNYGWYVGFNNILDDCVASACRYGLAFIGTWISRAVNIPYLVGCETSIYYDTACSGVDHFVEVGKVWGMGNTSGIGGPGAAFASDALQIVLAIDEIRNTNPALSGANLNITALHLRDTVFADNYSNYSLSAPTVLYGRRCVGLTAPSAAGVKPRFELAHYDNTTGDHRIFCEDGSSIVSDPSVRHTPSGVAWRFTINTATGYTYLYGARTPPAVPVAKIACVAGEQRTVTLWFRRSSTDLAMRLRVKGGQIAGVDNDVSASVTAAVDTWQQLSISFTPTEAGVVEVLAEAWTTNASGYQGWIDDLGVS